MVDWKTLFVAGKSVYDNPSVVGEPVDVLAQSMVSSVSSNFKIDSDQLLNKADLDEYRVSGIYCQPADRSGQ